MSDLLSFLSPAPKTQSLARSRFRLLASRLSNLANSSASDDAEGKFLTAWIPAVEDTSSVHHLPAAWKASLDQQYDQGHASSLLKTSFISNILAKFEDTLPDADYASLWVHLENSRAHLRHRQRMGEVTQNCEAIAQRVTQRVEAVYGRGDRMEADLDFVSLAKAVKVFLQDWARAESTGPDMAALIALHAFQERIIRSHQASSDAWQLLLHSLNTDPDLQDMGMEDLVEVLTEALPRFATLQVFSAKAKSANPAIPAELQSLAVFHIILTAAPQARLTMKAMSLLQFDRIAASVKQGATALDATLKGLREDLRLKLEQYQIDNWDEALAWMRRIESGEKALQSLSGDIGSHAQAAFSGSTDPRRLSGLCQELIQIAVRLGNGSMDAGLTAPVFRTTLVQDYGCDPKVAPWAQAEDLATGSLEVLGKLGTDPLLMPARTQLRKLAETVRQTGLYSISSARAAASADWSPSSPLMSDPVLAKRCQRDLGFLLNRVALEYRLARPATAQHAVLRWFAQEVAVHLQHLPDQDFIDRWGELTAHCAPNLSAELLEAAQNTHQNLPRLTTALKLIRHHATFGRQTAEHVMSQLPEYHKTVGENGTELCARDNALTLLQAGHILLSGGENPAEQLAAWWNSVVATYIVNRPNQLFEANLQGMHATLLENLSPTEIDTIFPVLHQVYKESLGIQDLPLLFFRESRDCDLILPHAKLSKAGTALPQDPDRARLVKRISSMADSGNKSLGAEIAQFFEIVEETFAAPITNQKAWSQLRPALQKWLKASNPTTLIRCLAAVASEGSRQNDSAGNDLSAFALLGVRLVVQDTLANQLESNWATSAGPRIAAAATSGGGDDVAQDKCARDLGLMNDFLIRQLRTQSFETGALNTIRFLIECVVPYVGYPTETWEEVFKDWQRSHAPKVNGITKPLFDALANLLASSAVHFPTLSGICGNTFRAGSTVFSTDVAEEKTLRNVFSTTLAHTGAPLEGLLNRELLRATGFRRGATQRKDAEKIFDRLVLHLDQLFDHIDGDIYYKLQENLPDAREAYLAGLESNEPKSLNANLQSTLAATELKQGVFTRFSRALSGPKDEEMTAELWRAIIAAGLLDPSSLRSDEHTNLLMNSLRQTAPEVPDPIFEQLSNGFKDAVGSAELPTTVRSFLSQTQTA